MVKFDLTEKTTPEPIAKILSHRIVSAEGHLQLCQIWYQSVHEGVWAAGKWGNYNENIFHLYLYDAMCIARICLLGFR